ncbi:uncharacterized protein N7529_005322 [Penicillium soppii]|uniref:uncharacterized protein n=1 Tax=Penicillium soppii TaxID=69789 RepID=UPI0025474173|nr:uncharacterized protein N7529_005322 [Penicillium soppii]KAJ5872969.1 hypothetical protein N7529_005322 [Penicillium soppii]
MAIISLETAIKILEKSEDNISAAARSKFVLAQVLKEKDASDKAAAAAMMNQVTLDLRKLR